MEDKLNDFYKSFWLLATCNWLYGIEIFSLFRIKPTANRQSPDALQFNFSYSINLVLK